MPTPKHLSLLFYWRLYSVSYMLRVPQSRFILNSLAAENAAQKAGNVSSLYRFRVYGNDASSVTLSRQVPYFLQGSIVVCQLLHGIQLEPHTDVTVLNRETHW